MAAPHQGTRDGHVRGEPARDGGHPEWSRPDYGEVTGNEVGLPHTVQVLPAAADQPERDRSSAAALEALYREYPAQEQGVASPRGSGAELSGSRRLASASAVQHEGDMFLTTWRFLTLLLTALLMGATVGHALEMPQKMTVGGALWLTFQHTLYRYFALLGGPTELGAVLAAAGLAYLVRKRRPAFALTLAGAVALAVSLFVVRVGFVWPVNNETATWTAETVPTDWAQWPTQWEYAHWTSFLLHLGGFSALVLSVLLDLPNHGTQDLAG